MKSILLKLDDVLLLETDILVKAKRTSRSSYIKVAIEQYNLFQKTKALEEQILKEIQLLKKSDPDEALKKELEAASLLDLQTNLNE